MTKKTTKRALLMSALSLVLCLSMLIGTTFAWFTDSVTSGENKIVAGNLDVDLQVKGEDDTWTSVEDPDLGKLFAVDLWEPGVVAVETFKAINVGNLALKYNMYLSFSNANTVKDTEYSLADVIKVALIKGEPTSTDRDGLLAEIEELNDITNSIKVAEGNLDAEEADIYTVVAYWAPTNNDNNYNLNNGKESSDGEPLHIDFAVTLAATQDTVEEDSFDKFYDEDATLSGPEAMKDVINQGAVDANNAIVDAIKAIFEENEEDVPENIAELVYFDESGLQLDEENGDLAITLHFEEGSFAYVDVTYAAVKALIGNAVNAQAGNIYSIKIENQPIHILNGDPSAVDIEGNWVEIDLKNLVRDVTAREDGIAGALKAAEDNGIRVEIVDMEGNTQIYRMDFELNWSLAEQEAAD